MALLSLDLIFLGIFAFVLDIGDPIVTYYTI